MPDLTDDELLAEMIANAAAFARRILIDDGHETLLPVWMIVAGQERLIIGTPWSDDEQKAMATSHIRSLLKTKNARAYCFTCEAWAARYDLNEIADDERWPEVRPIDRPNRQEVVTIFASTRSKQKMVVLETIRDPDGKVIELKDKNPLVAADENTERLSGTMPSLFD